MNGEGEQLHRRSVAVRPSGEPTCGAWSRRPGLGVVVVRVRLAEVAGGAPRGRPAARRRSATRPSRITTARSTSGASGPSSWATSTIVAPRSLSAAERVGERLLVGQVDAGGRLVEEEQVGLAGQGAGDQHPLLLAAGERGDAVAGPVGRGRRPRARRRWRRGRPATAGAAGGGGSAGRRRPPPTPRRGRRRRRRRAAARSRPAASRGTSSSGVPNSSTDPAASGRSPVSAADQGGLAGAVGAHQRDELARRRRRGRCRAGPGGRRSRRRRRAARRRLGSRRVVISSRSPPARAARFARIRDR